MRSNIPSASVSRRGFLAGIAGSAAAAILVACGGESSPTTAPASTTVGGAATRAGGATTAPTTGSAATSATAPASATGAAGTTAGATMAPATAGSAVAGSTTNVAQYNATTFPAIANLDAAKKYAGASLVFSGGHNPPGSTDDENRAKKFTADTGVNVRYVAGPDSTSDRFAEYQRFFSGRSADLDIVQIDVVYPTAFAANLTDLTPALGEVSKQHYPNIIQNNTVDGKLVGIPYAGDFGMLYYRTDLLDKYGFKTPPKTWQELQEQATKIQEGERAANPNFTGFVFQGKAYEGLTCDALEWFQSNGAGGFVDDGKVTINSDAAIKAMTLVKGWIGTISPRGVTSFGEEEARNAWQSGNAAFMRNWPYAYPLASADGSAVKGKFDVAPLPAASGQKPVGTVGGWQMGVSRYSKSPEAAIEFARYYSSAEMQTWGAVVRQAAPTIPSVAMNADVAKANPLLAKATDVVRVTRPSQGLGENYNQGSTAIFQAVNGILNGMDPKAALDDAESKLSRLVRRSR